MQGVVEYVLEPLILLLGLVVGILLANMLLRWTPASGADWLTRRRKVALLFGVGLLGLFFFPVSEVIQESIRVEGGSRFIVPFLLFVCLGGLMVDLGTIALLALLARGVGGRLDRFFSVFQPGLETASQRQGADLLLNWTGWGRSPWLRDWVARHISPETLARRLHVNARPARVSLALVLLEMETHRETVEVFMNQQGAKAWNRLSHEQLQVVLAHGTPRLREEALRQIK